MIRSKASQTFSLAQELLGWSPRVALKEDQMKTIPYFEQLLSDKRSEPSLSKNRRSGLGDSTVQK